MRSNITVGSGFVAILFSGAIFGIFFAWICTTMWGLDEIDPRIAIPAMQAMNAEVRNALFFPAFFLTPCVLATSSALTFQSGNRTAATWFGAGTVVYLFGAFLPTAIFSVPLNEALSLIAVPESLGTAQAIWDDYSSNWQFWNTMRTISAAIALLLCAGGLSKTRTGSRRILNRQHTAIE